MKLTITKNLFLLALALSLSACGVSLSDGSVMRIEMYGTIKSATSAAGDQNPAFQTYKLTQVALVNDTETTTLIDTAEDFKIVDRAQLLYEKDVSSLKGKTYTGITITFDAAVEGGNAKQEDLTFTLANPVVTLTKSFEIESAKNLTFTVLAHWGNTLSEGAMTEPDFEVSGP